MTSTDAPRWGSYVAVGDSFTEGLWDTPEGPDGPLRGWADLLATHLSARRQAAGLEPLAYANLAIRGRLIAAILDEQLPRALAQKPDLVSIIGGGNDLLRPNGDPDVIAARIERAVVGAREAGADVLLSTGMDTAGSPLVRTTRGRTGVLNSHLWTIARRHGASVLDVWGLRSLQDWRMWADDRIHLTPAGHERVAQAALVGLGLAPDTPDWDDPLTPLPPLPLPQRLAQDGRWARDHLSPWVGRHLRGRSSGDGRPPKRPTLTPLP